MGLVYLCVVTIKVVLLFAGYEYIVAIKVSIETRYRKTLVMSGKRWILSPGRCYTTLTHSHTTVYIEEILHKQQTSYTNIYYAHLKKGAGWRAGGQMFLLSQSNCFYQIFMKLGHNA